MAPARGMGSEPAPVHAPADVNRELGVPIAFARVRGRNGESTHHMCRPPAGHMRDQERGSAELPQGKSSGVLRVERITIAGGKLQTAGAGSLTGKNVGTDIPGKLVPTQQKMRSIRGEIRRRARKVVVALKGHESEVRLHRPEQDVGMRDA